MCTTVLLDLRLVDSIGVELQVQRNCVWSADYKLHSDF